MKKKYSHLRPGEIFRPPWSPDGLLMVKAGNAHAWTINYDGPTRGWLIGGSYDVEYFTVEEAAEMYDATPEEIRAYIKSLPIYKGCVKLFDYDLKPGDWVAIYADPMGMRRLIGVGKLIEKLELVNDTLERWRVEIDGRDEEYFIKTKLYYHEIINMGIKKNVWKQT